MAKWTSEQQKAIETRGHNVIVSAGAGSGKTAVLTERVFRLLCEGTKLDEILVLTFTNAAAYEMRTRIKRKLLDHLDTVHLADKIDASDITTFDAYALSIVKKYHFYLGVGRNISIIDENVLKIKKRKILNDLFEQQYLRREPRFLKMISQYALRDDNDIKEFAMRIDELGDLKIDKKAFFDSYLEVHYQEQRVRADLETFRQLILEQAKEIVRACLRYEDTLMGNAVNEALMPMLKSVDYDTFQEAIANFKFPRRKKLSDEDNLLHDTLIKACDKFSNYAAIGKTADVMKRYYETKETVSILLDVLKEMNEKLDAFKRMYDVFSFNDVSKLALKVVSATSAGKDIKKRLKYIMIDEYQDTSDIQEAFVSWIANDNVYMVGDIKQSIYRFRNANSDIFSSKYEQYRNGCNGEAINLNANFRSRSEVTEDINELFRTLMTRKFGGADYAQSHVILHGNMDYDTVGKNELNHHLELFNYVPNETLGKNEYEARLIAEDIQRKVCGKYLVFDKDTKQSHDATYNDFAILIDRKTQFELYQKVFSEYGIPLKAEKDSDITNSDVIMAFQNLVRLFYFTKVGDYGDRFRHAFLSVSRSFLFETSDQETFEINQNMTYVDTTLMRKMTECVKLFGSQSISRILGKLIDEFEVFERLIRVGNVIENRHKLEGLVETAMSMETIGYGMSDFVEYFADLKSYDVVLSVPINDGLSKCVKLMSVHKSKGLEFPIIYYAGLSSKFNESNLRSSFLTDNEYGIVLPLIDDDEASNIYHYLIKMRERNAELSEQVRLFYVALTRAKEKMICLNPIDEQQTAPLLSITFAHSFKDFLKLSNADVRFGKLMVPSQEHYEILKNKNEADLPVKIMGLDLVYTPVIGKRASKQTSLQSNPALLLYGHRIHRLLEVTNFRSKDTSFIEDDPSRKLIDRVLMCELFLHLDQANILKEYEFVDETERIHGFIDLMLVYPNKILLIDYKLKNLDDREYVKQLGMYRAYVEKTFQLPVTCYLLAVLTGELKKVEIP
jgi:ATP-dependent helicase/nuclease subunit A